MMCLYGVKFMVLTLEKIVDKLVAEYGLNRREATDLIETFFEDIRSAVNSGHRVPLLGFGTFVLDTKYYHVKKRNIPPTEKRRVTPKLVPTQKLKARIQRAEVEVSRDVD